MGAGEYWRRFEVKLQTVEPTDKMMCSPNSGRYQRTGPDSNSVANSYIASWQVNLGGFSPARSGQALPDRR